MEAVTNLATSQEEATRILNEQTENVPIDAVKQHPANPRRGNIKLIAQSIQENGWYGALVAQKSTGHILIGNHRYQAARDLGFTEIPVIWVDVNNTRAAEILVADNRSSDIAFYDNRELADLLQGIEEQTETLIRTLYTEDDLSDLLAHLKGDHYEPNLEPNLELHNHTGEDVDAARQHLKGQFDGKESQRLIMCPHCGEEFYLDE